MATAQELLDATEAAYLKACEAQSYTVSGRAKTMALLQTLMQARRELKDEIAAESESGGSMASLGRMDGAR